MKINTDRYCRYWFNIERLDAIFYFIAYKAVYLIANHIIKIW